MGALYLGFLLIPHRGFETITIANKGFCDHSDSLGAAGRFGQGDVQWMTAGRGVQHAEMFPLVHTDKENTLELFQIWLNLPRKSKFVDPHFKMLWHEDIPIVDTGNAKVKIIAGDFNETKAPGVAPNSWAADTDNHVAVWNIHISANATFTLPKATSELSSTLYFYDGDTITINDHLISQNHGILLDAGEEVLIKAGLETAHLLLLQGKPIDEPVVKHGPFVMNTNEEIENAMQEYRLTQFGGWPWPHTDNVHAKKSGGGGGGGRFAKYPDGTLIEK